MVPEPKTQHGNTVYWVIDHPVFALVVANRQPRSIVTLDKRPATRHVEMHD